MGDEGFVFRVFGQDGFALAVQAQNDGRAVEGAEHDDHAAVFAEVRNRFRAASGQVLIGDGGRIDDAKGVAAFGRAVDVAVGGQRRGGDKEDVLAFDPRF